MCVNNEEEKVRAEKVLWADIIVEEICGKPYYSIKYYSLEDFEIHIGYSSYDLKIVQGFLKECFDIIKDAPKQEIDNNKSIAQLVSGGAATIYAAITLYDLPYMEIRINKDTVKMVHTETGETLNELNIGDVLD